MWLVVAVVAALGFGGVVWLVLDDEAGPPTAVFDGAEVTYTGPEPLIVGEDEVWTVTMVNESDLAMIWGVAKLTEPNPTIEEYRDFLENWDGRTHLPWAHSFEEGTIQPGETIERFSKMSGTVTIDFMEPGTTAVYTSGFIQVVVGDE